MVNCSQGLCWGVLRGSSASGQPCAVTVISCDGTSWVTNVIAAVTSTLRTCHLEPGPDWGICFWKLQNFVPCWGKSPKKRRKAAEAVEDGIISHPHPLRAGPAPTKSDQPSQKEPGGKTGSANHSGWNNSTRSVPEDAAPREVEETPVQICYSLALDSRCFYSYWEHLVLLEEQHHAWNQPSIKS